MERGGVWLVQALLRALVWWGVFNGAAGLVAAPAWARASLEIHEIAPEALPPEARHTLDRIVRGGPFLYRKDGAVFHNREHRLPRRPRGYYTEYTVPTPGALDRGARRIVAGGVGVGPLEFWYSDNHYRSFRRIRHGPRSGDGFSEGHP